MKGWEKHPAHIILKVTKNPARRSGASKPRPTGEVPQCAHWGGEGLSRLTIGVKIMFLPHHKKQLQYARALRKEMTPEERHLWFDFLRNYPVKIYKQKPIDNYIVDFCCISAKLVIELDGSQHYEDAGKQYDFERTEYLEGLGFLVVRFSNLEINREFRAVCEYLDHLIQKRISVLQKWTASNDILPQNKAYLYQAIKKRNR